jgi:hypothetical protein
MYVIHESGVVQVTFHTEGRETGKQERVWSARQ